MDVKPLKKELIETLKKHGISLKSTERIELHCNDEGICAIKQITTYK